MVEFWQELGVRTIFLIEHVYITVGVYSVRIELVLEMEILDNLRTLGSGNNFDFVLQ